MHEFVAWVSEIAYYCLVWLYHGILDIIWLYYIGGTWCCRNIEI